jgi:hypothetical protein
VIAIADGRADADEQRAKNAEANRRLRAGVHHDGLASGRPAEKPESPETFDELSAEAERLGCKLRRCADRDNFYELEVPGGRGGRGRDRRCDLGKAHLFLKEVADRRAEAAALLASLEHDKAPESTATGTDGKGEAKQAPIEPDDAAASAEKADNAALDQEVTGADEQAAFVIQCKRVFMRCAADAIRKAEQGAGLAHLKGAEIDDEIVSVLSNVVAAWTKLLEDVRSRRHDDEPPSGPGGGPEPKVEEPAETVSARVFAPIKEHLLKKLAESTERSKAIADQINALDAPAPPAADWQRLGADDLEVAIRKALKLADHLTGRQREELVRMRERLGVLRKADRAAARVVVAGTAVVS